MGKFNTYHNKFNPFSYLKLPPKKITNNINNVDKYSKITANKSNSANNESSISEDINNSQTRNEGKEILNITDERERQLLEEENASLMNELETLVDQAKDVEKQIMEISELQNLFALKVAQQSEDIEHNFNIAISSKSNINNAAKELTKATKKGVDFRVFVLLFLIISSFALLFLHSITD
jgi:syntaxin 18